MEKSQNKFLYVLIIARVVTMFLTRFTILRDKGIVTSLDKDKIIVSYESEVLKNHVDFYKYDEKIIIHAYSENKFDVPNEIEVPYVGEIDKDMIKLNWLAVGGQEVEGDSDSIVAARVKIISGDKVIYEDTIDLIENAWDAFDKALKR